MATLAVQAVRRAGLNPAYTAATSGGDKVKAGNSTFLHVKNGGGSSQTVTVATPRQAISDVEIADLTVAVPAGQERMIGPLPPGTFMDPSDGLVHLTYTGVTSVTIGAFEVPA